MKCPRCQHENRPGAKFCEECAAPLARACVNCGAQLSATAKFCSECAHPADPAAPPTPQRFGAPETYTPKHLAERIINSKAALEGERKQVTVLFADLKGSMELLADRDPEEARKILDPVLERMMEAVHRYEGTVNQVMGDGIMALFGAPIGHEDHAVRACYAALKMQEATKRYAEGILRSYGVPVEIRVGLNSGEVVVRAIGSDLHMDYTAVGQTTHLAARMEQMAMAGSILLSADALRLVEGLVEVKPLGPVNVKGLSEPVEVYEVTGAGPARTRLQAATRRGLTRFVGRDAEVEHLRRVLGQASAGRGQVVAIVGEAGVGKSRLVYEFTHSHRVQDWLVLEAPSVSYGKATSYLPVIDLLKGYFKIGDRDDHREMRAKVLGRVLGLDRALEPLLPPLLALLDVPVEDSVWQNLDPPQRRQRILDAVKRLLLRESQVQPLLVVFEDLHWIDAETQAMLDGLVETLPTARLLLLVNYRPEYQHGWSGKTYYRQLRIDPLPPERAEELLEALLGNDPGLQPLKRLLVERTEGNPFFLEESVRTLVETKVLTGERAAYHLAKVSQTFQIPATAQAILAARIDRLSPEDKRLLQAASVIGKDVPFGLLQAIAELPDDALRRGLTQLQAAEFLYEARLFPDLEYTFKHALTHDVAYGSLLQDRRSALHRQIVAAIERLYPDRLAEYVERLAHHAVLGEVWEKAVTYLQQAGAKAFTRSSNREALAYFEQALNALTHLPETRETREQAIDVRFNLWNALLPLGERARMNDYLREAEALARALDDQRRIGLVSVSMSNVFWWAGDNDGALESAQRGLDIAGALDDLSLQVVAALRLGQAYHSVGDYRRAAEVLRGNAAALKGVLAYERFGRSALLSVISREYLVLSLAELGDFSEGIAQGEEALRIAEAVDHAYSRVIADLGFGGLCLRKGDVHKAIPVLEHALSVCQAMSILVAFPPVASYLGFAYTLSDRLDEAIPLLERAVDRATSMTRIDQHSLRLAYLSEAYLRAGRMKDAIEVAERAVSLCREHHEQGVEVYTLRLLGEIAAHRDPPEVQEGEERYRQAITLSGSLGMRPLVAHCHLGLGKLYRRTGQREQAREHLATATTMYREMGMAYWLEKAEAEHND